MDHEHDVYGEVPEGLPEVSTPEFLWVHSYYDGVQSGAIRLNGRMHWAHWIEECPIDDEVKGCGWYRRYLVYAMTDEQIAFHEQVNRDFRSLVYKYEVEDGTFEGWAYPIRQKLLTWEEFYEKYPSGSIPEPRDQLVGWFVR